MHRLIPPRALLLALIASACAPAITAKDRAAAQVHYDIAVASMNNNDMRGALRDLLTSVERDPELPQTHNALGMVYHSLGHLDDSLLHYERAVELKPDFSEAQNNLGTLYITLGRYSDAIAAFKKALSDILYATPALAEGNLGWAYYKSGDTQKGVQHLRNAVAGSPKFCRGYEWLARIFLADEKPADVITQIKRFEKYCIDDVTIAETIPATYRNELFYYLAVAYLKRGDRQAANETFTRCSKEAADEGFGKKCADSLRGLN